MISFPLSLRCYHGGVGLPRGSVVKNLPASAEDQETQVGVPGQEVPLEVEMATHSSILAWEIPWTEEAGGLQSIGSQRVRHDWVTKYNTHYLMNVCIQIIASESWNHGIEHYRTFIIIFFWPCGAAWKPSSSTRDGTCVPPVPHPHTHTLRGSVES